MTVTVPVAPDHPMTPHPASSTTTRSCCAALRIALTARGYEAVRGARRRDRRWPRPPAARRISRSSTSGLPDIDGIEVVEGPARLVRPYPIIVLSARARRADQDRRPGRGRRRLRHQAVRAWASCWPGSGPRCAAARPGRSAAGCHHRGVHRRPGRQAGHRGRRGRDPAHADRVAPAGDPGPPPRPAGHPAAAAARGVGSAVRDRDELPAGAPGQPAPQAGAGPEPARATCAPSRASGYRFTPSRSVVVVIAPRPSVDLTARGRARSRRPVRRWGWWRGRGGAGEAVAGEVAAVVVRRRARPAVPGTSPRTGRRAAGPRPDRRRGRTWCHRGSGRARRSCDRVAAGHHVRAVGRRRANRHGRARPDRRGRSHRRGRRHRGAGRLRPGYRPRPTRCPNGLRPRRSRGRRRVGRHADRHRARPGRSVAPPAPGRAGAGAVPRRRTHRRSRPGRHPGGSAAGAGRCRGSRPTW